MLIFINEKIQNNKLFLVLMNSSLKKLNRFKEAFKQLFEKPIGLQNRIEKKNYKITRIFFQNI